MRGWEQCSGGDGGAGKAGCLAASTPRHPPGCATHVLREHDPRGPEGLGPAPADQVAAAVGDCPCPLPLPLPPATEPEARICDGKTSLPPSLAGCGRAGPEAAQLVGDPGGLGTCSCPCPAPSPLPGPAEHPLGCRWVTWGSAPVPAPARPCPALRPAAPVEGVTGAAAPHPEAGAGAPGLLGRTDDPFPGWEFGTCRQAVPP